MRKILSMAETLIPSSHAIKFATTQLRKYYEIIRLIQLLNYFERKGNRFLNAKSHFIVFLVFTFLSNMIGLHAHYVRH